MFTISVFLRPKEINKVQTLVVTKLALALVQVLLTHADTSYVLVIVGVCDIWCLLFIEKSSSCVINYHWR